ncbi:MAG: preprotein translocase subunit YajC [Eubacterium sp.]|nr:preprotein translocase subunit YajC [Eubacterium sp.]
MTILATASSSAYLIIWIVIIVAMMYFMMIRPQKKEQSRKETLMSSLAIGDTVLTTSGFYGTLIDIQDDMVIVEFGSNKNCRIPMQKAAIADVEKPENAVSSDK